MIDPNNITKFDRTQSELEEFLLFCIIVAGKNSFQQAKKLEKFLSDFEHVPQSNTPFKKIRVASFCHTLKFRLMLVKMGQYDRIAHAFAEVTQFTDLNTVTLSQLEAIKGIGPKTARFFLMHTRPNQVFAALDTHILRWMRQQGENTPKATPTGARYLAIEKRFLEFCDEFNKTPAELDLTIWKQLSQAEKFA